MSKKNTLAKIVITGAFVGTSLYMINNYLIKKATNKNLLKNSDGSFYKFRYGNIFYKVKGEGKPVLLIHDIDECSSGAEWSLLENELSKTRKVYTIDLLGCGRSEKAKLTYNQFLYVQLINDFINHIICEQTDIIATGKSAAPVIMSAKLNKDSIDRIIFINPVDLKMLNEVPDCFLNFKKHMILCPIVGTFIYNIVHKKENIDYKFISKYFSNIANPFEEISEVYYESAHVDKAGSKYLYASILANDINMNVNHALKSIDKDIIIISGEDYMESNYVPDDYFELNNQIECISILETAYLPQLENPSKVCDIIQEYWK